MESASPRPLETQARRRRGLHLALWIVTAVAAVAMLLTVLRWDKRQSSSRWSTLASGRPQAGLKLFQDNKCSSCHGGGAGERAPDLAAETAARSGPDQLVAVMWNHAPKMWEQMQLAGVTPPVFSQQEMADLLSYLYALRYVGQPGDALEGERVFRDRGCSSCHSVRGKGGRTAKDLGTVGSTATVIGWATAMWNHPAVRGEGEGGRFYGREMNDLFGYVQGERGTPKIDRLLLAAEFGRGWTVFREKSCVACHSVKDEAGRVGPELGPGRELPATVVLLAGSIWNHSPAMWNAMEHLRIVRPRFAEREMADLIAFLYSFRYAEPGGSSKLGEVLFEGRGCGRCHGTRAQGTSEGPELRGRGENFNSVTMAAALWRHGPAMYRQTRDLGLPWPLLGENDVGDLIAFLNATPEARK